jgi:metal-responsive CopG/Arc/MetJ family transcriptional regulator
MARMTKRSISLPAELYAEAEAEALGSGKSVSEVIAEALRKQLKLRDGMRAVEEVFAEYGEPSQEADEWAEKALRDAGVIP